MNKNAPAFQIPSPVNREYDQNFKKPTLQLPKVNSNESLSPFKGLQKNQSPNSRVTLNLLDSKDPYIPITVLNIRNQKDFFQISNLISNTYDFQSAQKEDNTTSHIRKKLSSMSGSYDKFQTKLKSNPFGVFGGSPKERVYAP